MRTIKTLTNNRFLNIKEVADTEMHVKAYQFAERKGVDSIAFICVENPHNNTNGEKFLLNHENTPPLGILLNRAFGGSIDKEKSLIDIVLDEVREEAGYSVDKEKVYPLGKIFVSTQMNQYCHVFLVEIEDSLKVEREPENETEATSSPIWLSEKEIMKGSDWKAIVILQKSKMEGLIS